MKNRSKSATGLLILSIAVLALAQGGSPAAADRPQPRIIDDRTEGEGDRHERRHEWFFSSRRAGIDSPEQMAELRMIAVDETRQALAIQAQRSAESGYAGIGQSSWYPMGPAPSTFGGWRFGNISGRISSITADWDGETLYVGSASGGLWKSTNDGQSWTQIFDTAGTMTIGTVAVDPNDPDVIWAGTGENHRGCENYFGIGLMRSGDAGATWEARNGTGAATLQDLSSFANVVVDPRDSNHLVTGGRIRGCVDGNQFDGGLYTSNDAGLTWTVRLSNTQVYEIAQDPSVLDVYWAGTSRGIYKSSDNGLSWNLQTASGLPNGSTGRTELAIAPSDSNVVYALFDSGGNSLWRTTDGGASWTQRATGSGACEGQCWWNMVLRVHRTNPDIVYRGTIHIFKSTNGGQSWSDLSNNWGSNQTVHQDMHALLMHPTDTDTVYVGGDGGIWKTEDGGSNFINLNGNLNVTQFYAIGTDATDPGIICGGAQDNSSLVRTDSNVWDLQRVTGDGFVCHIDPFDGDRAYVTSYPSGTPSIFRSTTGLFGPFDRITGSGSGISSGDRDNWVTPYLLDPTSPNILYVGTQRVYRSTDYGSSWTAQNPTDMTAGSGALQALEINRNYPTYLWAGTQSGKAWFTANSGDDWVDATAGLPGASVNDIASDPTDPERAFAVVGGFNTPHLWEWTLAGGWTARGLGLPNVPANSVLMLTEADMLVGTDTGVFRSVDGGQTFAPYMAGFPQGTVVTDLKPNLNQNIVTAGTYGRGAWQVMIDPVAAHLVFDSVELPFVEEDGDGDDKVEPGETWAVRPLLRNIGGQTALGVTARLATGTPGVTILEPATVSFGNVSTGMPTVAATPYRFSVDPTFPCGDEVVFDLVELQSVNAPGVYPDQPGILNVTVLDRYFHPFQSLSVDETFENDPGSEWSRTGPWRLEPNIDGVGSSYRVGGVDASSRAWLHLGGTETAGGAGIAIPADAIGARLILVHSYATADGPAAGRVVIDAAQDGRDEYTSLKHGNRELPDRKEFNGSSAGWVTDEFDLTQYRGRTIYLAFAYGSPGDGGAGGAAGRLTEVDEWSIDRVTVETLGLGVPICQITDWPGSVPATARFSLVGADTIEATWDAMCNAGDFFQTFHSIHVGDLDALHATGSYSHAPIEGRCDRFSPATFTPGAGNEYYLVTPNAEAREGGHGQHSNGQSRPQTSAICGERREAVCP